MNTKFCPKCGKELPQESVFCPYCMTKLIDVKTGNAIKVKKKIFLIPILAFSVVAIITVCAVVIFSFQGKLNNDKTNDNIITTTESTTVATTAIIDDTDYSSYMGVWCDEGTNADSIALDGGSMLEIISVKEDLVRFTYTKISSPPYNRIAIISNVATQVIDGIGTFTFDNDGWGNSGTGKIKFLENEIFIETKFTNKNDSANWHIGGVNYLKKDQKSILDFKNYLCLNVDFDNVKDYFGEEIKEKDTVMNDYDAHYYDGFRVDVDIKTNKIIYITVYYDGTNFIKTSPCYGVINENSTYDDVYSEYGEPNINKLSDGYVAYNIDGGELRYFFDDNLSVSGFSLQSNEIINEQ